MSRHVRVCSEGVPQDGAQKSAAGVLVGRFDHALDPKKRLTIPREWRTAMGDPEYVYVFRDPASACLDLVPREEMDDRLARLREVAPFNPKVMAALQAIGSNAEQLSLDSAGRIRIGDALLAYANLKSDIALVGAVRMARLWNPKALKPTERDEGAAYLAAMQELGFA